MPPKIAKKPVVLLPIPTMSVSQQIQSILDEKVDQQGSISYLVQWKNSKNISQCTWQPQFNLTAHKNKIVQYQQRKKNEQNLKNRIGRTQKIEPKPKPKIQSQKETKKIQQNLSQEKDGNNQGKRQRGKSVSEKQGSLDGFIKSVQKKLKKDQEEDEQLVNKSKQKAVQKNTNKFQKQTVVKSSTVSQKKNVPLKILAEEKKSDSILDKLSNIRLVSGFKLKNGQIQYDCKGQDKDKRQLLIPHISSQLATKLNSVKVIDFLESCLWKGYNQFNKNK